MLSEATYRDVLTRGWAGGKEETRCGKGSTMSHTLSIRNRLPDLMRKYSIASVCDAGAGDLHWIKSVEWTVNYQAFDLHPRHVEVKEFDIRAGILPRCDLILCRLVLGHMNPEWVGQALSNFKKSATYLLATSHEGPNDHLDKIGVFNHWNLSLEPFGLGDALESIIDTREYLLNLWALS